jgi:hypothetical protein
MQQYVLMGKGAGSAQNRLNEINSNQTQSIPNPVGCST